MEPINRQNWEAWAVDRLDGTLDEARVRAMDAFLARHPDLAAEWAAWSPEAWDAARLPAGPAPAMPGRDALRRPEPRERRLVPVWWAVTAAAAALAGLLLWGLPRTAPTSAVPTVAEGRPSAEGPAPAAALPGPAAEPAAAPPANAEPRPAAAAAGVTDAPGPTRAHRDPSAGRLAAATPHAEPAGDAAPSSAPGKGTPTAADPEGTAPAVRTAPLTARPLRPAAATRLAGGSAAGTSLALAGARPSPEAPPTETAAWTERLPQALEPLARRVEERDGPAAHLAAALTGERPLIGERDGDRRVFRLEAGPIRITHTRNAQPSDS
jgi:hypothetical protein